ncbi:MAG TPA: EcsC family protein [Alphaproteobacteria bacterium]
MALEGLRSDEIDDLRRAVDLLEEVRLPARLAQAIGRPMVRIVSALPAPLSARVVTATRIALDRAADVALMTLAEERRTSSDLLHKAVVAASGALGGGLGLAALPIELPITTVLMLRSIADIAREEGEDLTRPETGLACMEVFALGARTDTDDDAEAGYFAIRSSLATVVSDAARYLAATGAGAYPVSPVTKFIAKIGARFGIAVSHKMAAQLVPVIGALGGAAINYAFIDHFQTIARGHFIVRRLERSHGQAWVSAAYEELRARRSAGLHHGAGGDGEGVGRAN